MNPTDQENNQLLKNFIKLEKNPHENDIHDNDAEFSKVDKKYQLDYDNNGIPTEQINILIYNELKTALVDYEKYNIPKNLPNRKKSQFFRMRGLAYMGGSRNCPKMIEARKLGEPCKSKLCAKLETRHCSEFTEDHRKAIFCKFWYEMNWSEKRLYVKSHVVPYDPPKRQKPRNPVKFYLDMDNKNLMVCQNMFLSTLALGANFIREWVTKPYQDRKENQLNEIDGNIENEPSPEELNEDSIPIKMSTITDEITNFNMQNIESRSDLPKSTLNENYIYLSINQRKEIGNRCKPKHCHNNKCLQIENEQRNVIYNQFWFEMIESEKLTYVQKNIEVIRTGPIKPNLMDTYYYFLKISKRRYPVCKEMFLSTLGLDEKNVEKICDDYKKYLLSNLNAPVEEDDEDAESDGDNVNCKNEKTHDDPLNVEYIDVYGSFHMDYENLDLESNTEINETNIKSDESKLIFPNVNEITNCSSIKDFNQLSCNDYSENGDYESDEDSKIEITNFYSTRTRSSHANLSNKKDNNYTSEIKVQLSNGIFIPPEIGPPCKSSLCKKIPNRMCSNITEQQRQDLFKYFWDMSITERQEYVRKNIKKLIDLKIRKYKYSLIISNEKFPVCKNMFVNTLCLHDVCIRNWLNNIENYAFDLTYESEKKSIDDMNKSNPNCWHEGTLEKIQIFDDFLDSLPKIPPNTFPTQNPNTIYFNENITGRRAIYQMYAAQMRKDGIKNLLSSKHIVKRLLLKKYKFYQGKKLRQGNIDNIKISDKQKKILQRGQREQYRDKALARKSPSTILINIDSFKVKMSPNMKYDANNQCDNSNTRLCCYHFIVCNILTNHGMCYWFCETDASITNNSSYITCLYDYFNNFCKNSQQIIIYSPLNDNRFNNIDMANALLDYSIKMKKIIIQKFLPFNERFLSDCNTIFNSVERKLQTFEIILPSDYVQASIARRNPCDAKWMNFRVFKDFSVRSMKHRYYKVESSDGKLMENFAGILYKENGELLYKYEFDDEWSVVPQNLKGPPVEDLDWPQLYLERRKISAVKYQSLQSLKAQIPRDCHFFYDYLTIEI